MVTVPVTGATSEAPVNCTSIVSSAGSKTISPRISIETVAVVDPAEAPLIWLQAPDAASLAFLVLPVQALLPEYRPDITADDVAFVGLEKPEDGALLSIVTIRGPGKVTLNLKGPIVLNRRTLKAKQVIPINAAEYSVQHPLPVVQS